jgi:hypothetical protein
MRRITQRRRFRADLKRQKRRGKDIEDIIAAVASRHHQDDRRISAMNLVATPDFELG